jgi:hypothetical protein
VNASNATRTTGTAANSSGTTATSSLPSWVLPAAIGAGALIIVLALRK